MNNSAITHDFIDAWEKLDLERLMSFFTEDASYANVPMGPPNVGTAAIREFIAGFLEQADACQFIVHHQIEGPNGIVMNERTDRLKLNGTWVELPVMGIFEFRDGKISAWRDYFDMAPFNALAD